MRWEGMEWNSAGIDWSYGGGCFLRLVELSLRFVSHNPSDLMECNSYVLFVVFVTVTTACGVEVKRIRGEGNEG